MGVINDPDPEALPPGMVQTAIGIAAQNGDSAFFQAALDFAQGASNQRERRLTLYTLAEFGAEADMLALMDLVKTDAFQGQETWGTYLAALKNKSAGSAAWTKFKADFDAVIERTPDIRKPQTAGVVANFCTAEAIEDAISFIESKAALMPGYERRLAQASETAQLCAAFRAEKGNELAEALLAR